jgi:AcrR family transcriptional regulator
MGSTSEIKPDGTACAETRRQLLEAAGEVFAEAGFRDATVREICRRGNANIAAVNYHFGDKGTLYLEVLRYSNARSLEKYPPLLGVGPAAPPEEKLHAFVHSLLLRVFDKGPTSWHGKLMLREMIEPTAALDSVVEERVRPMADALGKIVGQIMGRPSRDELVMRCAFSVVSQCVFYHHCRPVMARLFPEQSPPSPADIAKLADHITRFSLAAMKAFSTAKLTAKPKTKR